MKKKIEYWKTLRNKLPNLQLFDGSSNESKNRKPLTEWLKEGNEVLYSDSKESTDIFNFENYYMARKKKMEKQLLKIFGITK